MNKTSASQIQIKILSKTEIVNFSDNIHKYIYIYIYIYILKIT